MSQHDMNIANQGFPAFRADLNDALAALVSNNSGASAPATTFANMPWYDTTNNIFKIRNEDNDAWISIFTLDQSTYAITAIGSVTLADVVSLTGTQTLTNKTLTSPTLTNPTVDKINTGIANAAIGAGNASIMKNRIINGAMVIDQRNAGASVTPASNGLYTLDRWGISVSQGSKFSVQQNAGSVTPPVGFSNYLGLTSTSAYSVGVGENFALTQPIEGYNFADMGWGTADAKTITLSFWVRSSLTGTFGGAILNSAQNRSYVFSYTISSANTWTYVTTTIAGDTTGTWVGATNGIGANLFLTVGAGSNVSKTAGSWGAGYYVAPTGSTSVVGTSGATFYITGVQLEVGSSATGFEYRQYGTELALCQRYYETGGGYAGSRSGDNLTIGSAYFHVTKRATPTVVLTGSNSPTSGSPTVDYMGWFATGPSSSYSNTMTFTASAEL